MKSCGYIYMYVCVCVCVMVMILNRADMTIQVFNSGMQNSLALFGVNREPNRDLAQKIPVWSKKTCLRQNRDKKTALFGR
jgi:hypothetical protein